MITNNLQNGSILVSIQNPTPVLIISSNGLGNWGYDLEFGNCWLNPGDEVRKDIFAQPNKIKAEWRIKAKLKLDFLYSRKFMSNLDYIEALAKLKEYELSKV